MIFDWYKIFNLTEFQDSGLVSKLVTVFLEGIGEKEILIARGNEISILYEGVLLPCFFHAANTVGNNPYYGLGGVYAAYISDEDDDTQAFWLGVLVDE